MKVHRVTQGGQISLPASVRRRWQVTAVAVEDMGDHVVVRPLPDNPVEAARGALKARLRTPASELRSVARRDESAGKAHR